MTKIRFPGQYYDQESGLHYNYFRDYDPRTGRYLEPDPIGTNQGYNHLYLYGNNNPIIYIDPTGLVSEKPCCPSAEKDSIENRIKEIEKFQMARSYSSGSVNYAITYCFPLGIPYTVYNQNLSPRVFNCVIVHENVHRSQCSILGRRKYNDMKEYNLDYMEKPGYDAELNCLKGYRSRY